MQYDNGWFNVHQDLFKSKGTAFINLDCSLDLLLENSYYVPNSNQNVITPLDLQQEKDDLIDEFLQTKKKNTSSKQKGNNEKDMFL